LRLSDRALRLAPSATLEVVAKAKQLKRSGKPVISFGAGEPDFRSPAAAILAAATPPDLSAGRQLLSEDFEHLRWFDLPASALATP